MAELAGAQNQERTAASAVAAEHAALNHHIEQLQQQAQEIRQIFETDTLNKRAFLIPFPPLWKAKVGDVVRIKEFQLLELSESSSRLTILDDIPTLSLSDSKEGNTPWKLFKIVKRTSKEIILSGTGAYGAGRPLSATVGR